MQDEKKHNRHGRGRNVSCMKYGCTNYRKKIGRKRGGFSDWAYCPVCGEKGFEHGYTCKVGKDNIMLCNCHLSESEC